jgi:hypothetical protein
MREKDCGYVGMERHHERESRPSQELDHFGSSARSPKRCGRPVVDRADFDLLVGVRMKQNGTDA